MECPICFFKMDEFSTFKLKCCNNIQVICIDCVSFLTNRKCPFCRAIIPDYPFQISRSLPNTTESIPMDMVWMVREEDDSRTLRRQIRRQRKLQERERQQSYNRLLSKNLKESYFLNRAQKKTYFRDQIHEDEKSTVCFH